MHLLQGNRFQLFRSVLMGIPPDYVDNFERKNTHPKLLPEVIESMTTESVESLVESGVTGASHKKRNGVPTVVPATKQVPFNEQLQVHPRSVLSDVQIAKLKERIDRSWKIRSAEHNGQITKRLQSAGHSSDKLLTQ